MSWWTRTMEQSGNGLRAMAGVTRAALASLLVASVTPALAQGELDQTQGDRAKEWQVEITPYVWFAGVDGDVTARGRTVSPSIGFSDLFDATDVAGSFLVAGQYQRWVAFTQFDYVALNTSNLDNPPAQGEVDTHSTLATLAAGYQFDMPLRGSTVDLLLGARITYFDNTVKLNGIGEFSGTKTIVDPVLMVRPSFRLTSWLRLNPTMAISALGNSDWGYELQPHLQFQITDRIAARAGYRRLYYDYKGDAVRFNGSMHGFILGLGVTL